RSVEETGLRSLRGDDGISVHLIFAGLHVYNEELSFLGGLHKRPNLTLVDLFPSLYDLLAGQTCRGHQFQSSFPWCWLRGPPPLPPSRRESRPACAPPSPSS